MTIEDVGKGQKETIKEDITEKRSRRQRTKGLVKITQTKKIRRKIDRRLFVFNATEHDISHLNDLIDSRRYKNPISMSEYGDDTVFLHETIFLKEEKVISAKYESQESNVWYLESAVSNHMKRTRPFFSELNKGITGRVNFGEKSCVEVKGKGSILFQGKGGQQ